MLYKEVYNISCREPQRLFWPPKSTQSADDEGGSKDRFPSLSSWPLLMESDLDTLLIPWYPNIFYYVPWHTQYLRLDSPFTHSFNYVWATSLNLEAISSNAARHLERFSFHLIVALCPLYQHWHLTDCNLSQIKYTDQPKHKTYWQVKWKTLIF